MARMGYFTHPDIQGRLNYPPGGLLEACCFVMLSSYYVLHFYMYTAVAGHLALSTQLVKTFILHTYLALPPSLFLSPFHRSCCPSLKWVGSMSRYQSVLPKSIERDEVRASVVMLVLYTAALLLYYYGRYKRCDGREDERKRRKGPDFMGTADGRLDEWGRNEET